MPREQLLLIPTEVLAKVDTLRGETPRADFLLQLLGQHETFGLPAFLLGEVDRLRGSQSRAEFLDQCVRHFLNRQFQQREVETAFAEAYKAWANFRTEQAPAPPFAVEAQAAAAAVGQAAPALVPAPVAAAAPGAVAAPAAPAPTAQAAAPAAEALQAPPPQPLAPALAALAQPVPVRAPAPAKAPVQAPTPEEDAGEEPALEPQPRQRRSRAAQEPALPAQKLRGGAAVAAVAATPPLRAKGGLSSLFRRDAQVEDEDEFEEEDEEQAEDKDAEGVFNSTMLNVFWAVAGVCYGFGDTFTSYLVFAVGGGEANPVMQWLLNLGGMPTFVIGKTVILVGLFFMSQVLLNPRRRPAWSIPILTSLVGLYLSIHNINVLLQRP